MRIGCCNIAVEPRVIVGRWYRIRAAPYSYRLWVACLLIAQILVLLGNNGAMASCNDFDTPNFARIPMKMAVIASPDELKTGGELRTEIDVINAGQRNYELTARPSTDVRAAAARESAAFDAVLVFDKEMMAGKAPKYNEFLFTYRDADLSNETIIIDYRSGEDKRIVFTFLQIAATATKIQPLLIEVGLMALADFRKMSDPEFLDYYYKLDRLAMREDGSIKGAELDEIMRLREQTVKNCFLRPTE